MHNAPENLSSVFHAVVKLIAKSCHPLGDVGRSRFVRRRRVNLSLAVSKLSPHCRNEIFRTQLRETFRLATLEHRSGMRLSKAYSFIAVCTFVCISNAERSIYRTHFDFSFSLRLSTGGWLYIGSYIYKMCCNVMSLYVKITYTLVASNFKVSVTLVYNFVVFNFPNEY